MQTGAGGGTESSGCTAEMDVELALRPNEESSHPCMRRVGCGGSPLATQHINDSDCDYICKHSPSTRTIYLQ